MATGLSTSAAEEDCLNVTESSRKKKAKKVDLWKAMRCFFCQVENVILLKNG